MKTLHKPKFISSKIGLGLPTNRIERHYISDTKMVSVEIWNEMEEPWSESGTIIAKPGYKWITEWVKDREFIVTRFSDNKGIIVAHYFDVCSPVKVENGCFTFFDLYLDVWYAVNEEPKLLDEADLEKACKRGFISNDQRRSAIKMGKHIVANIAELVVFNVE